jgi:hypothetical protein
MTTQATLNRFENVCHSCNLSESTALSGICSPILRGLNTEYFVPYVYNESLPTLQSTKSGQRSAGGPFTQVLANPGLALALILESDSVSEPYEQPYLDISWIVIKNDSRYMENHTCSAIGQSGRR